MLMWIGQAAMKYGNKYGIPIASTNHAMPENLMDNLKLLAPVSRPINYILTAYGARFHAKADVVTLPTQSAIDMFKASDKVDVPMYAVSNGIDLSRFTPGGAPAELYDKFDLPKNKKIVSYIGRLDAEKHLSVLVEAFNHLSGTMNDIHLMIVGSGTDEEHLKRLVYQYDIADKVTFTGRVSDEEIMQLHKIGTVYVMPSPAELQSIATLEAMASGQPVVAVDAGALRELCQDGRNGYLCERDNITEITDGIKRILSDDELREKYSKESLAIASTHDLNTTLERFESLYSDIIKS
jgi:glycosyltransferase involved in cell wall biosynthesis